MIMRCISYANVWYLNISLIEVFYKTGHYRMQINSNHFKPIQNMKTIWETLRSWLKHKPFLLNLDQRSLALASLKNTLRKITNKSLGSTSMQAFIHKNQLKWSWSFLTSSLLGNGTKKMKENGEKMWRRSRPNEEGNDPFFLSPPFIFLAKY